MTLSMQVTNAKIKLFADDTNLFLDGKSLSELENTANNTVNSGGSRIWQGRVTNPSERGTGWGEAPDMRAEGSRRRGAGGLPQKI